jgi:hypothetical protein
MSALIVCATRSWGKRMLDESSKPLIREDLQYRELDDGGVIYDTSAERIHTLNVTAAYVWNSCDGAHNLKEIASELHEHAKVSYETALQHVHDAIKYFENEGLLRSQ